jgi:hypothetical protein
VTAAVDGHSRKTSLNSITLESNTPAGPDCILAGIIVVEKTDETVLRPTVGEQSNPSQGFKNRQGNERNQRKICFFKLPQEKAEDWHPGLPER